MYKPIFFSVLQTRNSRQKDGNHQNSLTALHYLSVVFPGEGGWGGGGRGATMLYTSKLRRPRSDPLPICLSTEKVTHFVELSLKKVTSFTYQQKKFASPFNG